MLHWDNADFDQTLHVHIFIRVFAGSTYMFLSIFLYVPAQFRSVLEHGTFARDTRSPVCYCLFSRAVRKTEQISVVTDGVMTC